VNYPEEGFEGATIPELIDRIIIGPMKYPTVTVNAFVEMLFDAGIQDAAERVVVSRIPLRT
jgi:hypothetical protein